MLLFRSLHTLLFALLVSIGGASALAGCSEDDDEDGAPSAISENDAGSDDAGSDDAGSDDAGSDEELGKDERACGSRGLPACDDDEFCDYPTRAQCGETDAPGICRAKPDACTLEYLPVCGCDGVGYDNACAAASAGVSVRAKGECDSNASACGGLLGLTCDDDSYCKYEPDAICGRADATGICESKPSGCPRNFAPVCGCDGETYDNDCVAAAAGVSVESMGECRDVDDSTACGGLMGLTCPDAEYCNYPADALCGSTDAVGTCEPKPMVCPAIQAPVCGCNDRTYASACNAAAAGVAVLHEGECDEDGPQSGACGGLLGLSCDDDEYCDFPVDAQCGDGDATGVCRPVPQGPQVCPQDYTPVCGCDGTTYPNACGARAAGVSIASDGECEEEGTVCGGIAGVGCDDGEYCDLAAGDGCEVADGQGRCRIQPQGCPRDYNPVCGCDGETYSNACSAAAEGESIQSRGECR